LNRGRQLYSAGRPSRWALAHILVYVNLPPIFKVIWARIIIGFDQLIHLTWH